ncbi:hypothetical protein DSO57_1034615 [Entomophthora muscae]|uniref:Uncharacterized protein n=1 Tax=Entomophthora muscae TaxID=34485 RepID=A0ACC2SNQ3_9FUNG|nr:hypothetical protein DSO57_1034615 [Entomophthora muscae]
MKANFFTSIALATIGLNSVLGAPTCKANLARRSYDTPSSDTQSQSGNDYGSGAAPVASGIFHGSTGVVAPAVEVSSSAKSYDNKEEVTVTPYEPVTSTTESTYTGREADNGNQVAPTDGNTSDISKAVDGVTMSSARKYYNGKVSSGTKADDYKEKSSPKQY